MSDEVVDTSIVTPVRSPGSALLLAVRRCLAWRPGLPPVRPKRPFRLGKRVIAARHAHVRELLERDLDFGIAAVNAVKIGEVNGGPFILGMDRSAVARAGAPRALRGARRGRHGAAAAGRRGGHRGAARQFPAGGRDRRGRRLCAADRRADRAAAVRDMPVRARMLMEVARSVFAHTFLNPLNEAASGSAASAPASYMKAWIADGDRPPRARRDPGDDLMGRAARAGHPRR